MFLRKNRKQKSYCHRRGGQGLALVHQRYFKIWHLGRSKARGDRNSSWPPLQPSSVQIWQELREICSYWGNRSDVIKGGSKFPIRGGHRIFCGSVTRIWSQIRNVVQGWPVRLITSFCWHQFQTCVLVYGVYRVTHLVANLDWVDFDFYVPPSCPAARLLLPNSHQPRQNRADRGTLRIQVNPTQSTSTWDAQKKKIVDFMDRCLNDFFEHPTWMISGVRMLLM